MRVASGQDKQDGVPEWFRREYGTMVEVFPKGTALRAGCCKSFAADENFNLVAMEVEYGIAFELRGGVATLGQLSSWCKLAVPDMGPLTLVEPSRLLGFEAVMQASGSWFSDKVTLGEINFAESDRSVIKFLELLTPKVRFGGHDARLLAAVNASVGLAEDEGDGWETMRDRIKTLVGLFRAL